VKEWGKAHARWCFTKLASALEENIADGSDGWAIWDNCDLESPSRRRNRGRFICWLLPISCFPWAELRQPEVLGGQGMHRRLGSLSSKSPQQRRSDKAEKIWKTQMSPSWILFEEVTFLLKPEKWSEWMGGNLVQVKEKGRAKALRQERNWHIWETEEVLGLRSYIPQVHNPAPLFTSYLTLGKFTSLA